MLSSVLELSSYVTQISIRLKKYPIRHCRWVLLTLKCFLTFLNLKRVMVKWRDSAPLKFKLLSAATEAVIDRVAHNAFIRV